LKQPRYKVDLDYAISTTIDLIKIPSENPPGREAKLAKYIAALLAKEGFDVRLQQVSEDRFNVIAELCGCQEGPTVVLNGHLDVVPANGEWKYPPFAATIDQGRIYGRGAADMKAGLAAMISAVKTIKDNVIPIKGRIMLVFVADEEVSNLGTKAFLQEYNDIQYAVIGEPTQMELAIAHRGCSSFKITAYGSAGHASVPEKANNAIMNMNRVLNELVIYGEQLRNINHELLSSPTISVGVIKGGSKSNIVPDKCEIIVDRRLLPGENPEKVLNEFRSILDRIGTNGVETRFQVENLSWCDAGFLDSNSSLVKIASRAYLNCFGRKPHIGHFRATCEQSLFLGKGIEAIVIGPGSISQAHAVDEYVAIEQVVRAAEYYVCLLIETLGLGG
jgi:succinyl-diaminopimelate desuccinylase